jgi:hypothetical protein
MDLRHTEKNLYLVIVLHKSRSWWIVFKHDDYNFYSAFGPVIYHFNMRQIWLSL